MIFTVVTSGCFVLLLFLLVAAYEKTWDMPCCFLPSHHPPGPSSGSHQSPEVEIGRVKPRGGGLVAELREGSQMAFGSKRKASETAVLIIFPFYSFYQTSALGTQFFLSIPMSISLVLGFLNTSTNTNTVNRHAFKNRPCFLIRKGKVKGGLICCSHPITDR